MYSKKYLLENIEEFNGHNYVYDEAENSTCYLAYLKVGERGWFLYEDDWFGCHRMHTSTIQNVEYNDDKIIVETKNTRLTFRLLSEN